MLSRAAARPPARGTASGASTLPGALEGCVLSGGTALMRVLVQQTGTTVERHYRLSRNPAFTSDGRRTGGHGYIAPRRQALQLRGAAATARCSRRARATAPAPRSRLAPARPGPRGHAPRRAPAPAAGGL